MVYAEHSDLQIWILQFWAPVESHSLNWIFGHVSLPTRLASIEVKIAYEKEMGNYWRLFSYTGIEVIQNLNLACILHFL